MDTNRSLEKVHPLGEGKLTVCGDGASSVLVDTYGGCVHVEWDPQAAVTPLGQLPFFIDFLKTGELFAPWVEDCPLEYTSNNAPSKVDVLGTLMLSVLAGQRRYAHIDTVRCDTVNPALLGMSKVVSSSSARRAFRPTQDGACAQWLQRHLERCYEPLLYEPLILDVDTHVKVLYGQQERAVLHDQRGLQLLATQLRVIDERVGSDRLQLRTQHPPDALQLLGMDWVRGTRQPPAVTRQRTIAVLVRAGPPMTIGRVHDLGPLARHPLEELAELTLATPHVLVHPDLSLRDAVPHALQNY